MASFLERALRSGSAAAGFFGLGDIAKLFTDPATQQLALDRLTHEKILKDPRSAAPPDLVGAGKLRPMYQAVGFKFREPEIESLRAWCGDSSKKLSVRLVTGGSGRGKTRLMVELAGSLRENGPVRPGQTQANWSAGFLDLEKLAKVDASDFNGPLAVPFASRNDLCVIVDYAEGRSGEHITGLLKAALEAMDGGRQELTRIVLIARQRTEVFDTLLRDANLRDRAAVEIHDEALDPVPDPKEFFEATCEDLGVPANARTFPNDLTPDCGLLSLAALLAATDEESISASTDESILNRVLDHERSYWEKAARQYHVPEILLQQNAQELVAATLTLYGLQGAVADIDAGVELVSNIPLLADQSQAVKTALVRTVSELYPHPDGAVEGVGLDLLGDEVVKYLSGHALCPAQNDAQVLSALTRITWLARKDEQIAAQLLDAILRQDPESKLNAICKHASSLGEPLGKLAADWIQENPIGTFWALQLAEQLPYPTVSLREFSAVVTSTALGHPHLKSNFRAGLLNNLAIRLSDLGDREAALSAAQEAVDLYRQLAAARPEAFTPNLAMSLNSLANRLSNLGDREAALSASQEAVDLYRQLTAARPEAFTPNLAGSLNNLASRLSDLGDREAALSAAQEAVDLYRQLAAARPEAFTPNLASSLNNLANRLSDLGDREAALSAAQEAVDLYRQLAAAHPEAFTPDFASSLNNLANRLSDLGDREAALSAAQEAVDLYRQLAAARPGAFTPNLAGSLNNLAIRLSDLGDREAALSAAQEAVDVFHQLAAARPGAFTPNLAGSLNSLANRLSDLGDREAALSAAQEAVDLYRQLAAARPEAFTPNLAASLNNLAIRLSDLGDREAGLSASQEAVDLYRQLAAARPEAFTPNLASSLNNLASRLSDLGDREAALSAAQEAVDLYRQLAAVRPEAFTPNLAGSLNNLANRLSDLGDREAALSAAQEAVDLYRQLAAAHPEAFTPDLAMSLRAMSKVHWDMDMRKVACDDLHEAITLLGPLFLHLPMAFAQLAGNLYHDYSDACSELGESPDKELLEPILAGFQKLNQKTA